MPKKMGRPRLARKNALGVVFTVRLRPDQAREVRQAIHKSGQNKSLWLRQALLAAARGHGDGVASALPQPTAGQ